MVKTNWRDVIPEIVRNAGIDWPLLLGQSLKNPKKNTTCMEGMMYISRALLQPGLSYQAHSHDDHEEVYYIIEGEGEIRIDDEVQSFRDGDIMYIGINQIHEIRNTGDKMINFLAIASEINI